MLLFLDIRIALTLTVSSRTIVPYTSILIGLVYRLLLTIVPYLEVLIVIVKVRARVELLLVLSLALRSRLILSSIIIISASYILINRGYIKFIFLLPFKPFY